MRTRSSFYWRPRGALVQAEVPGRLESTVLHLIGVLGRDQIDYLLAQPQETCIRLIEQHRERAAEEEPADEADEETEFLCEGIIEPPIMDPEHALTWLSKDDLCLAAALDCGHFAEDAKTRSAFNFLAGNLRTVREAALAAIRHGPAKVTIRADVGPLDYGDHTRDLSRVVAGSGLDEDAMPEDDSAIGFRMLAEMLARRLAEPEED